MRLGEKKKRKIHEEEGGTVKPLLGKEFFQEAA